MSKFDQRMLKSSVDMFHFELIPDCLTYSQTAIQNDNNESNCQRFVSFQVFHDGKLCDQSKRKTKIEPNGNKISFCKVFINFTVNTQKNIEQQQFLVKVLIKSVSKQLNNQQKLDNEIENSFQIDSFNVKVSQYIQSYKNNNKKQFQQCVKTKNMTLNFNLYTQRSRFALQKYIRKSKQLKNESERKGFMHSSKRSDPKYQMQRNMLTSPKSQKTSQISENQLIGGGVHRFISPTRRIIKDKKLIVRNSKSVKKGNVTITEEGKSCADSKSLQKMTNGTRKIETQDRSDHESLQKRNQFLTVDRQISHKSVQFFKRAKQIERRHSENIKEKDINILSQELSLSENNKSQKKTQQNVFVVHSPTKIDRISQKNIRKLNKSPQNIKNVNTNLKNKETPIKNKVILNDDSHRKPENINVSFSKILKGSNFFNGKIFLSIFVILSAILLLNVMSPSKKI